MRSVLLLAVLLTGCTAPTIDCTGDYLAGLSIACGVAAVQTPQAPAPTPTPDGECQSCSGLGWLGDGRPRADCPDCDRNGDGDNDDPLPSASRTPSGVNGTENGNKNQAQGMVAAPPAAPAQDAPEAVASPWRTGLLPHDFAKPLVLCFGDSEWAESVRVSVPARLRDRVAWERADGKNTVAVYHTGEDAEWVEAGALAAIMEKIE